MTIDSKLVIWKGPLTRLGRWAVGLDALFVFLILINFIFISSMSTNSWWQQNLLPFYGIFMLLCGLAAAMCGLIAVIRQHESSWLVWLTILPGAFIVVFLLGEFLVPH